MSFGPDIRGVLGVAYLACRISDIAKCWIKAGLASLQSAPPIPPALNTSAIPLALKTSAIPPALNTSAIPPALNTTIPSSNTNTIPSLIVQNLVQCLLQQY